MKSISQIVVVLSSLFIFSGSIHAQSKSGIICYQQKITLSFKNTANKPLENDSTGLKSFLLIMAEGKEVSLYHKVIYSGSMSKKYGVEEVNSNIKNTYSSDSYIALRNKDNQTEQNFDIIDKKIVPTANRKIGPINFKYTGITKKIMGFACKEILYETGEGRNRAEIKAYVTSDLPPSAGFEIYSNLPGAIIQLEVKNRILTIAKIERLKTPLTPSFFKP